MRILLPALVCAALGACAHSSPRPAAPDDSEADRKPAPEGPVMGTCERSNVGCGCYREVIRGRLSKAGFCWAS